MSDNVSIDFADDDEDDDDEDGGITGTAGTILEKDEASLSREKMSKVIGIDLGTTNCCVSIMDEVLSQKF